MPAPMPSEAVKERPSKTCFRCYSKTMMTTRWSPPSRRKNKKNSRHSWHPRTPDLKQNAIKQTNNNGLLSFLVNLKRTFVRPIKDKKKNQYEMVDIGKD